MQLCTLQGPTRHTFLKVHYLCPVVTPLLSLFSPNLVIALFLVTGSKVWKYTLFMLDYGYPKKVKRIPHSVDAALYFEKNKKLVFIKVSTIKSWHPYLSHSCYLPASQKCFILCLCCLPGQGSDHWQWDELMYNDLSHYPKPLTSLFTGVPSSPDAAFTWTNGKMFFFKGDEYWRVNELLTVDRGYPQSKMERWMRC